MVVRAGCRCRRARIGAARRGRSEFPRLSGARAPASARRCRRTVYSVMSTRALGPDRVRGSSVSRRRVRVGSLLPASCVVPLRAPTARRTLSRWHRWGLLVCLDCSSAAVTSCQCNHASPVTAPWTSPTGPPAVCTVAANGSRQSACAQAMRVSRGRLIGNHHELQCERHWPPWLFNRAPNQSQSSIICSWFPRTTAVNRDWIHPSAASLPVPWSIRSPTLNRRSRPGS